MKTFILLSKIWRARYKEDLPFIYVMVKSQMREDLKRAIVEYVVFKSTYLNALIGVIKP